MFSRDIAPILAANCIECHSKGKPGFTRGKLDLTTFDGLMLGTPKEKVVVAGNPAESHLIARIKGEETPRMPQGGDRKLADATVSKIEAWVKAGAKLDDGLDPRATLVSYALTPEQARKASTATLGSKEREARLDAAGRKRWKEANPKLNPEVVPGQYFVAFSNLPRDRVGSLLKTMEAEASMLKRLLGSPATDWPEKISLYIFNDPKDFIEFVRTVERREVEGDETSSARLSDPIPYVAVIDPARGKDDSASRRRGRTRRGDTSESGGQERSLAGILVEAVGAGTILAQKDGPRWFADGLGSYLAAQVEPRSHFYQRLRQNALERYQKGWESSVNSAFGDGGSLSTEEVRSIGFAIVECLMAEYREKFRAFAQVMTNTAKDGRDESLEQVFGIDRETLLASIGEWVQMRYGDAE